MKDKKIQIIEWLIDMKGEPPKSCYTCLYYINKSCAKFQTNPPDDFKMEPEQCQEYEVTTPF
jgi:hypothetical protein